MKNSESPALAKLRAHLAALPPGPVADEDELISLLVDVWPCFRGSDLESMAAHKLWRMEKPHWDPTMLSFSIERHGGYVQGSSRAEIQQWDLDLDQLTATCHTVSHRQLRRMQQRLDVWPTAEALCALIKGGQDDHRLRWTRDRRMVRVQIGRVIPAEGPQQTVAGRRRRLADVLRIQLEAAGWVRAEGRAAHTFRQTPS